jgi:hypothetical protein
VREILIDALVDSMLEGVRHALHRPKPAVAAPPAAAAAPAPPPPELGWYVYGIVAADAAPLWTTAGIDAAHAVSTLREGSVAAVVSRVAFEDFGEARLREHLADMAWVEATARAHEGVLEQTRAQVTVVPMRMCTVYRSEDGLREMLRREAVALTEALAHLDGKTEMGVKVFADRSRVEADAEPEVEGPNAGAAYMQRRRRERDRAEEVAERLERAAQEIHERLAARAAEARVTPVQRPEASGRAGEMILNGVYLVEDDSLEQFAQEVSELEEAHGPPGVRLELTGPWPAYNFVPDAIGAAW